jgi:endonuclease III
MTNAEAQKLAKKIKKHVNAVAFHRDKLRELVEILESIEQAHQEFESALDTLEPVFVKAI